MAVAFVLTFVILHATMSVAFLCAMHYRVSITDNDWTHATGPQDGRPKQSHSGHWNNSACAEQGKITLNKRTAYLRVTGRNDLLPQVTRPCPDAITRRQGRFSAPGQ